MLSTLPLPCHRAWDVSAYCTPSKQRGQFRGTAPLSVLCQERVEPASSSLTKSWLKMNKAILSEALVLWYVDFGQQEVFHSVSKVNGGIL